MLGTRGGRGRPLSLGHSASGPPCHDSYGQCGSSFIYQQAGRYPVPYLAMSSSGAFHVVTSSEHTSPSKIHSRLSERDSRQPISSQSADNDRVESPSRNCESDFRILGDSSSGHVCNCFKLPPASVHVSIPEPRALAVEALSQDWQGRSMYMFPPFPLLSKFIQKLRSTQEAEVILIASWWPKQSWFPHLLRLCVDHPLFFPYRRDPLSQQDQRYVSDRKSYSLMHGGSHATLQSSRLFRPGL